MSDRKIIGFPTGPVRINWSNPLTRGLGVFAFGNRELVGGQPITTAGAELQRFDGPAYRNLNSSSGYFRAQLPQMYSWPNTNKITMAFEADELIGAYFGHLFTIGPRSGWAVPYGDIIIRRTWGSNVTNLFISDTGDVGTAVDEDITGTSLETVRKKHVITYNAGSIVGYEDGEQAGTASGLDVTADWDGLPEMSLLNRSGQSPGEGWTGRIFWAAMWLRDLSAAEAKQFSDDPFQFLERAVPMPVFVPAAAGGTNVSATTKALTLATQQASVANDVEVTAGPSALTLTTNAATVSLDKDVSANTSALTLATQQATVANDVEITAGPSALTLTTQQASVAAGVNVQATTSALTLATQQATVTYDVEVTAGPSTLTLTPQQAAVTNDVEVAANTAALTLTTQQAAVTAPSGIVANTAALTLTPQQATITFDVDIDAAVSALTLTPQQATVTLGVNVEAATAALTVAPQQATITFDREVSTRLVSLTILGRRATVTGVSVASTRRVATPANSANSGALSTSQRGGTVSRA